MTKQELKEIIKADKLNYFGNTSFKNLIRYLTGFKYMKIGKYLILVRKLNYYQENINKSLFYKILCFFYKIKKNKLGEKLNIELDCKKIGKNLKIYHGNVVVNGFAEIGDNCELHGNNCIGNKGSLYNIDACPKLGDNIIVGVGSNIIGNVIIANNIRISANSLVNKNFLKENCLIGGVPAKVLKE